jgi:hypothetical protein
MNFHRNLNIFFLLIATTIANTISMSNVAATSTPVFQCMGERINDVNYSPWNTAEDEWLQSPWRDSAPCWMDAVVQVLNDLDKRPVSDTEVEGFYGLIGTDIWLGYPSAGMEYTHGQHGFDMPEDVYGLFKLLGTGDQGQEIEIWFIASITTPETLYVMPFRTTELSARSDGSYYGIHPCGAYAVPAADVNQIVDSIWSNW